MNNPNELIAQARTQNRLTLTEAESKILLSSFGIPVVPEKIAVTKDDAVEKAKKIGFPVVLKGLGSRLTHKTEQGLVKVDLRTEEDVRGAFALIKKSAGRDWEGCLVQPLIKGKREFTAGLFQDPQFGPVIMFGLGGIFTEALRDIVLRIAPFSRDEAVLMIDSLLSKKLLSGFRGDSPVDRELLINTLTGLSKLGMEHPEIAEIDINPLIIQSDGRVVAVDALVILNSDKDEGNPDSIYADNRKTDGKGNSIVDELRRLFHPESLAVIGASADPNKLGNLLVKAFMEMGYAGKLYCVNPSTNGTIFDRPTYKNVEDIPDDVVLTVICTPPSTLPEILEQCARKGVKGIILFVTPSSDADPAILKAIQRVKSLGIRISGPNSMGFYNPKAGMTFWPGLPKRSGPISCIGHSGGVTFAVLMASEVRKIGCSKAVSVGNEWDLNWTDFLEYFGSDNQTEIITGYLEGMTDGRRFLEVATEIGKKKPIICIKGGDSSTGNTFASSHTGTMAGSKAVWKAAFDQANIIKAVDFQDMITHTVMFKYFMNRRVGRRIGLVTGTGGPTVTTVDLCEQYGLVVPELSGPTKDELKKMLPPFGSSCRNPVDVSITAAVDQSLYSRGIQILDRSPDVDVIICVHTGDSVGEKVAGKIIEDNAHGEKPLVVIMVGSSEKNSKPVNMLLEAGIPAFDTQEGVIRALKSLVHWKERCSLIK
jgi:acyl-CoA synthetase (NDP forming)